MKPNVFSLPIIEGRYIIYQYKECWLICLLLCTIISDPNFHSFSPYYSYFFGVAIQIACVRADLSGWSFSRTGTVELPAGGVSSAVRWVFVEDCLQEPSQVDLG